MQRDRLYLRDMIAAADAIAVFVQGQGYDSFVVDDMRRSAVQKKLEIMGEAARALSEDVRMRHPELPWRQMTALRNIAVHQYFSLDWHLIWMTATNHVPINRDELARVLEAEFSERI